jgi:ribonuclease J
MEIVRDQNVDVLLCDCTSFMDNVLELMIPDCDPHKILPNPELPEGMIDDKAYYAGLFENVKSVKGLCVFNYYEREMDDASQLMDWAEKTGRKCVFEPEAAYIVHKFFGISPFVYIPDVAGYDAKREEPWMQELLQHCTLVSRDEICANPGSYMLQNTYPNIMELFSLPNTDAVYLHADGIPIGAFDPAYGNMRKIVDKTGFKYVTFFCENYFGHGYPQQVKWFVDQINPKVLIPCHSYNPERLFAKDGVQLLPEMYKEYTLENHVFSPLD